MRTEQTEPNFTDPHIKKVVYTAAGSITLPYLEDTYDTVHVRQFAQGTGASMSLNVGAVNPASYTISGSTQCVWDYTITNVGSGNYLIAGIMIETGDSSLGVARDFAAFTYMDSTNDYANNLITATIAPIGATAKYSLSMI